MYSSKDEKTALERKIQQKKDEKAQIVREMTRVAFCELVNMHISFNLIVSVIMEE
jgi:hypothetical protein